MSGRGFVAAVAALLAAAPAAGEGPPAAVLAQAGRQPRVAVAADGRVAAVYGAGNAILLRLSRDGGQSFDEAVRVAEPRKLYLGSRMGPKAAFSGAGLVATAVVDDGDLCAWRSANGGRAWSGPVRLNERTGSAGEGLHGLAAGDDGTLHAVWLDVLDGKAKLMASRSADGGATWTPRLAYQSPDGSVCECCEPSLATSGASVFVQWRNWLGGARDMHLAVSPDGGRSFGPARKLGGGTWRLRACPMDGGGLAAAEGQVLTVWRREEQLFSAGAEGLEQPLGEGRQPVVALGPGGAFIAWQEREGIRLRSPGAPEAARLGPGAFPAIAAAPGGRPPVVLAWERAGAVVAAVLR